MSAGIVDVRAMVSKVVSLNDIQKALSEAPSAEMMRVIVSLD
jgi:hypothetical protein